MLGVGQSIFDIFYPIGSYYETSDTTFNPNTAHSWYGTWIEDTEGQVLVSRNSGTFATVGNDIGEETHKLTISEMPSHRHSLTSARQYGTGTATDNSSKIGRTQSNADGVSDFYTNYTGDSQPHNNIQPSKVIIRWHRTA